MAKPSLALIPSGYADNKVFSVLPSNGDGDFDFTRGSTATRVNAQGLIETVTNDAPRLNYPLLDGVVQECPSLLLEPQRTNLVTYNNDLTNSNWITGNITEAANDTISPNGTLDASKVTVTLNNDSHYFQQTFSIGENDVTISAYVKNIDANFIQVTNAGNSQAFTNFDIQNGVIGTSGTAMSNQKIEKLPNDWYRISVTVDNSGFAITYMRFYFVTSASAPFNQQYLPTSAVSLNVWGVQCEIGNFKTSVIPTTTQAETRFSETCNGAGTSDTFNDAEGVLYAEVSALANDGSNRSIAIINSNTNRISFRYDNSANRIEFYCIATTQQYGYTHNLTDVTEILKLAFLYSNNNFQVWINGFKVDFQNSGNTPIDLSKLSFNLDSGTNKFKGNVKDLRVYNEALTDTELQEITTL